LSTTDEKALANSERKVSRPIYGPIEDNGELGTIMHCVFYMRTWIL
jgi:hypothetical protein